MEEDLDPKKQGKKAAPSAQEPEPEAVEAPNPRPKKKPKPIPEHLKRYYLVRFQQRSGAEDDEKVWLQVDGVPVQYVRDKVVPITHVFKAAVDDAKLPVYSKPKPGSIEQRKLLGWAARYPYTLLREITENEFLQALAKIGRGEELKE